MASLSEICSFHIEVRSAKLRTLWLALRFSKVMDTRNEQGKHPKHWSTLERLTSVIEEYNSMDGLQLKHAMDEDRVKSVYNLIAGTSGEPRLVIQTVRTQQITH